MTFNIYTLGCKVNTYESNVMRDALINNGYEPSDGDADIYIINTCTVTNTSDKKSMSLIRQCIRKSNDAIIVVCGCMSQHDPELCNIEGVSIIIGNKYKSNIAELIHQYQETKERIILVDDILDAPFEEMKLNNFDQTRAFVKIEDGCENYCTYCIIPYIRGKVRSKNPRAVLEEISSLVKNGHSEIVLSGIHTGHYGSDLENYNFADLLLDIVRIPNLERLRISSIEITEIDDNILNILSEEKIIVDHLHIPLQSGSDQILESMNRKYDKIFFKNKVNAIRNIRPNISLTTDIIVGFPGETEELFKETIDTVNDIRFSKIHVFPFSLRNGTKAELLPDHVDSVIKKERVKQLITLSKELEIEYMSKFIGQNAEVIVEKYQDGYLIGHTGEYLLVKALGNEVDTKHKITVSIKEIDYPYCIG